MVDYLHPSVSSRIIDNSTVFVTAQGLTTLFAAFSAPSGPDNTLTLVTSSSEADFLYGAPNMRNYGQARYNVNRWLDAGGQALCLRVLPYEPADPDGNPLQQSLYSMYIVEVGTKSVLGVKTTKVRARVLGDGTNPNISSATELGIRDDPSTLSILLEAAGAPDGSGFTWYPIFAIRALSRGAYGNVYGVRLELTTTLDNTYSQRLWQISIYSGPSQVLETYTVSMYPEAVDTSGLSQFLPDVLKTYSGTVRCVFNEDNYDAVASFINPDPTVAQKIDIFTLRERSVTPAETLHSGVSLASGTVPLVPIAATSLPLGGGTDGDWIAGNSLESLLYKAYSGSGDFIDLTGLNLYDTHFSDVWNKLLYPVDVILDANYPVSVKVAMSNFAMTRGDLMSFLDTGFTGSPAQALAFRSSSLPLNTFYTAIFTQDYTVFDDNTGSEIRVTPTYFLSDKIPTVDIQYGIHWPFVGPRRGAIVGFNSISWIPDEAYKEQLYTSQVNYAETDQIQTAFMSQTTSQINNSALSDISHVRALLRIRRNLERIGGNYRFEFNDNTTWGDLQYSVTQYLNTWIANRALSQADGLVYASKYDIQSRILRVKSDVTFTGIIERVMFDIVVNR